jgi:hypothetical protein
MRVQNLNGEENQTKPVEEGLAPKREGKKGAFVLPCTALYSDWKRRNARSAPKGVAFLHEKRNAISHSFPFSPFRDGFVLKAVRRLA